MTVLLKPALSFAKEIFRFNLIISSAIGFFGIFAGSSITASLTGLLSIFSVSLFTGGFLFAVYFYILRYKNRFYFYHNLGLNKTQLIVAAWFFNLPVTLAVYILIIVINAV